MSNFVLSPRSGLEQIFVPAPRHGPEAGVTIALCDDIALASIIVRKGKLNELSQRIQQSFGLTLPVKPYVATAGTTSFVWAGPGRWLAVSSDRSPASLYRHLREAFAGVASVANQSDGRSVIRVSGPKVRATLAKGIPIDLDPRVFRPGDTALTVAGHINVHLWQVDAEPTFEFAVFRSFAASFCEWLFDSAAEFGVTVR